MKNINTLINTLFSMIMFTVANRPLTCNIMRFNLNQSSNRVSSEDIIDISP